MSLATAKRRAEERAHGDDMPSVGSALLCTENGCMNRWTTTFYGRLCTYHEATLTGRRGVSRPVPVPSTPPQPHWQDDREDS